MKQFVILFAISALCSNSNGQQIIRDSGANRGRIIWYLTLSVNKNGSLGMPVGNYQAMVLKDVNGNKYLSVCNSDNWVKGTKATPSSIALYEAPGNAVQVVLDYPNKKFKFYPWNSLVFTGEPHHTNRILNFIGNDDKPYTISFEEFVGFDN